MSTDSLGTKLPKEIERVAELRGQYLAVPNGHIAAAMMKHDIDAAHEAIANQDIAAMIGALKALETWGD